MTYLVNPDGTIEVLTYDDFSTPEMAVLDTVDNNAYLAQWEEDNG